MTTIRGRLTRNVLLAFTLPAIITCAGIYLLVRQQMLTQFDRALAAKALAIAATTRQVGANISVDESVRLLREFDESEHLGDDPAASSFFQMLQPDGSSLRRSRSLGQMDLIHPDGIGKGPRFWDLVLPSGRAGRAIGMTFSPELGARPEFRDLPKLTLIVAVRRGEINETLSTLAIVLVGASILLVVATFLTVPRLVERGFVPLRELGDKATQIHSDSLGIRFNTKDLPDELTPIASRLNDLLARLDTSFERERQFSADLAHELRTPIAELRSLAELSMKWPDKRPPDADRDAHAIALQMEGIVTRLLALLRSERGQLDVTTSPVGLAQVVGESWRPFEDRAAQQRLRVTHSRAESIVRTDPVLLRSILSNLFENAVDYTTAGGSIDIQVITDATSYAVRVVNDSAELDDDSVGRLFDRFWRHDTARAGGEHSGLGLSLARAFAQALGANLTAQLENGRLTMTLQGPLSLH